MLVDSHCHLPLMETAVEDILAEARAQGIAHMLCVSVELETFPQILALARRYPVISASVGVHPNTKTEHEPAAPELAALAGDTEVVAIGETGLDYYRSSGDLGWQRDRFRTHIAAARQAGKPLIIHSRDAQGDTTRLLKEEGADAVGGVMHCFVDDWKTACEAMDLGFYISFSGIVTFKNAQEVQEVARQVPLDRLLVETDAPYLAPVPFRGKPNQPAFVYHTARFLAELRGDDFEELARKTTDNFFTLFKCTNKIN